MRISKPKKLSLSINNLLLIFRKVKSPSLTLIKIKDLLSTLIKIKRLLLIPIKATRPPLTPIKIKRPPLILIKLIPLPIIPYFFNISEIRLLFLLGSQRSQLSLKLIIITPILATLPPFSSINFKTSHPSFNILIIYIIFGDN